MLKRIVLYIVISVFIANTMVVSASILPCMQDNTHDITYTEMTTNAVPACHSQQPEPNHQHCEDACFCMHFSINQLPVIDAAIINTITPYQERLRYLDEDPKSLIPSPLYRPPIEHS